MVTRQRREGTGSGGWGYILSWDKCFVAVIESIGLEDMRLSHKKRP